MKRLFFLLLIFFPAFVIAQPVQVQKSTFVPKEAGVFHANHVTASNSRNGQTLVVWERLTSDNRQIIGRLINARGTPASGKFVIVDDDAASHPAVAYNPVRNEYILLYDDNPQVALTRSDIYALRLNAQGRPSGTATKITTDELSAAMANFFPKIVFNTRNSTYAAVWLREIVNSGQSDDGNNGLVGTALNSSGAFGGTTVLLQKSVLEGNRLWGPIPQDLTIHPNNGKVLVSYVQVQSGTEATKANYFLGAFNPSLDGASPSNFIKINNAPVDVTGGFAWGSRIGFSSGPTGNVFFVDTFNVKRRRIDAAGKLAGAAVVAFKAPKNNTKLFYPSVSFSRVNNIWRGMLVAVENPFSETGEARLWVQQLDSKGVAVGAPVRVDSTTNTDTAITLALVPLPAISTMTGFRFAGFYTLAGFKPPGQTYENSAIIKLNLTIPQQ